MSEENYSGMEEGEEQSAPEEQLSVADAMAGVITAPGDTYETIARTAKRNYWIIPILISIAVGLIASFLFMQDEELLTKTLEKQKVKMREQLEKSVKEGKMTQEDMDKALDSMGANNIFVKIAGYGGAVVGPFLILFILSILYMIALKLMKGAFDFTNILNVVGLAMLISALGTIISIVISIFKGEVSTLGPGLLFSESAVGEKMHAILTKIDLFSIWFYAVISIGLSKISGVSVGLTAVVVFGIFILYSLVTGVIF